ncbi:hypothetical protein [Shewanella algae]
MTFKFDNLNFHRIILHNVYKPNDEGRVDPFPSRVLTQLAGTGLDKLQQRISSVLGNGSHSLQMDIVQDGAASCFLHQKYRRLALEPRKSELISDSLTGDTLKYFMPD